MSNIRALLESMDRLAAGTTVSSTQSVTDTFEQELMSQYQSFVSEDQPLNAVVGTPQANTAANTAPTTTNTQPAQPVKPVQPGQPAPFDPMKAAQDKKDLSATLNQFKSMNPSLNVTQAADAITKDPKKLTPTDAKSLDAVASAIAPALTDKAASGQIKSLVQRLQTRK